MDRNKADDFIILMTIISQCLKLLREHLLLVEVVYEDQIIAAGLYFVYDKTIHMHLQDFK